MRKQIKWEKKEKKRNKKYTKVTVWFFLKAPVNLSHLITVFPQFGMVLQNIQPGSLFKL